MSKKPSQKALVLSYYVGRPKIDLPTPEVVDWATKEWERREGVPMRDPDRQIRSLAQAGHLVKVHKGMYRYDPDAANLRVLEEFTPQQKQAILERDGYKCAICGLGEADGVEIQIDHIKPREFGGEAVLENGQVLCGTHNRRKKHFKQTETGKRMFINLRRLAASKGDQDLVAFCEDILAIYDSHGINGHIEWDKP